MDMKLAIVVGFSIVGPIFKVLEIIACLGIEFIKSETIVEGDAFGRLGKKNALKNQKEKHEGSGQRKPGRDVF